MQEQGLSVMESLGIILSKLRTGQITLEALESFARTGETAEGVIMPVLGEVRTFPCPRCSKDAGAPKEQPFIFKAVHRSECDLYRWECTGCSVHSITVWDTRCGKQK